MKKKAVKKGKVVKAAAKGKKAVAAKGAKATGTKKMPLGKKLF
jgi:hypothetical protein